jgi:hypothetical protein
MLDLLVLAPIVPKLTGHLDLSWWLVCAPLIVVVGLGVVRGLSR